MIIEIDNFLSSQECNTLIEKYDSKVEPITSGERIDSYGNPVTQEIKDIHRITDWIIFKDTNLRKKILLELEKNSNLSYSDIDKEESFQFLRYKKTGHFTWHKDATEKKEFMTAILLLNDNFDGGNLLYKKNNEVFNFKRSAGTLVFFPTNLSHKVTEIENGIRYSIVTWIYKKPNNII